METPDVLAQAMSVLVGVGLAAACGFRVFVPLLVVSVASFSGQLTLSPGWEWIGSLPALIAFSVATVLEIGAYYVPWLDNALDAVKMPAAVVAGTVISASFITELNPFLKWSLAIIAGGGAAGGVSMGMAALRAVSTAATGGLANPVVSTAETGGSIVLSVIAVVLPLLAAAIVLVLIAYAVRKILQRRARMRAAAQGRPV